MRFVEVEPARAHDQHGRVVRDAILLARGRIVISQCAAPAVDEVRLPVDQRVERGRSGILEIGHEHARARIERVDDHLGVGRAGNFDAPVAQVGGRRRDVPVGGADRGGFVEKVGPFAGIQPRLALFARRKQREATGIEPPVKRGEEV